MNILLVYGDEPGTTGYYLKNALSKNHHVITCGPNIKTGRSQDIKTTRKIIDIESLIKKIKPKYRPNLILQVDSPFLLYLSNLQKVNCKTAFFWTDYTIKFPILRHYAKCFNYIFIPSKTFIPILERAGLKNIFPLQFGIDSKIHQDFRVRRTIDVGFVGHVSTIHNPKRSFYLEYLKQNVPLTIKTDIYEQELAMFYSKCKIVFNLSVLPGINMRTFEALACGALLVQNASCSEINDYFTNGKDFVSYRSCKQAANLIKYYLAHPKEAEMIARSGQRKALKNHSYQKRTEELIKIIEETTPQQKSSREIDKALAKSIFLSGLALSTHLPQPLISRIFPKWLQPFAIKLIAQIETLKFKWTIPFWYIVLILFRLRFWLLKRTINS